MQRVNFGDNRLRPHGLAERQATKTPSDHWRQKPGGSSQLAPVEPSLGIAQQRAAKTDDAAAQNPLKIATSTPYCREGAAEGARSALSMEDTLADAAPKMLGSNDEFSGVLQGYVGRRGPDVD